MHDPYVCLVGHLDKEKDIAPLHSIFLIGFQSLEISRPCHHLVVDIPKSLGLNKNHNFRFYSDLQVASKSLIRDGSMANDSFHNKFQMPVSNCSLHLV